MAKDDPATRGDLEALADATRKGFAEALKDALGNVIPSPTPKGDDDKGDDGGDDKGGDDKGGDDKGSGSTDWGFSGRWWGSK